MSGLPLAGKRKRAGRWLSRGVYLSSDGRKLEGSAAVEAARRDDLFRELSAAERLRQAVLQASRTSAQAASTTEPSDAPSSIVGAHEAFFLSLASYGVPSIAITQYAAAGINRLYPWQRDCLLHASGAGLEGQSLVYTAPTSGGKTLVSEILILRRLFAPGTRRAVFVVPLVSLVTEKVRWLEQVWKGLNLSIRGFYNNKGGNTLEGVDVAVCTIERANGLINRLIADGRASELSVLVLDELHMMAEQRRGYLLEAMVMKVRLACGSLDGSGGMEGGPPPPGGTGAPPPVLQIVGMSATLPNLKEVADWLGGHLFTGNERPVPLREYLVVNGVQYDCRRPAALAQPAGGEQQLAAAAGPSFEPTTQENMLLRPVRVFSMPPPQQQSGPATAKPASSAGSNNPGWTPATAISTTATPASLPLSGGSALQPVRTPLTSVAFARTVTRFIDAASPQPATSAAAATALNTPASVASVLVGNRPSSASSGLSLNLSKPQQLPMRVDPPAFYAVIASLCAEAVGNAHSTLVFCASRKDAEGTAQKIGAAFSDLLSVDVSSLPPPPRPGVLALRKQLAVSVMWKLLVPVVNISA